MQLLTLVTGLASLSAALSIMTIIRVLSHSTSVSLTSEWYGPTKQNYNYSYIGDEFPRFLDADTGPVEMTMEETVRFDLSGRVSKTEWFSLRVPWAHLGYLRLGPEDRVFAVALFHQLHCIDMLVRGTIDAQDSRAVPHHIHHCLNYFRHLFLCAADDTLEPFDFATRNYSTHPVGITRTCRDWGAIYDIADNNYRDFILHPNTPEV